MGCYSMKVCPLALGGEMMGTSPPNTPIIILC